MNKKEGFFRKYWRDIVIIFGIVICSFSTIFIVRCATQKNAVFAKIFEQNSLVLTIDLTKESDEVREIKFPNENIKMTLGVKKNSICVLSSECPHQDCVKTGWVSQAGKPIICVHYKVTIEISGESNSDVVIG